MSDRKYRGSYEAVTRLLRLVCSNEKKDLSVFFDQLTLSVLVRNGDAHLKNFGVLYDDETRWLAPLFDVVTTTIYPYERAGQLVTDRTMALRLLGQGERGYPLREELIAFGNEHCGIARPGQRVDAVTEAMHTTLKGAQKDDRIPGRLLKSLAVEWEESVRHF